MSDELAEIARLRAALEEIAHPEYGLGFNKLRGLARKALAAAPARASLRPGLHGPDTEGGGNGTLDLNHDERTVLRFLAESDDPEYLCYSFGTISSDTGLGVEAVRLAAQSLKLKGFARYSRALMDDEGGLRGAGYGATREGIRALRAAPASPQSLSTTQEDQKP